MQMIMNTGKKWRLETRFEQKEHWNL